MSTVSKIAAYLVCAVVMLSVLVASIEPILLCNPPGLFGLACLTLAVAAIVYILFVGPVWVLQRRSKTRLYLRNQLATGSVFFTLLMAGLGLVPLVPTVAAVFSGTFAGACLLLRAVAAGKRESWQLPGEWLG